MSKSLNIYGDQFKPTDDGRGVDIASQRQDELDLGSVAFVRDRVQAGQAVRAVDLGGGFGAQALRLAEAGAEVTMIDVADMRSEAFKKAAGLRFLQKDFAALTEADLPENYAVLYSQRAIHYVPYAEAKRVLTVLFNRMAKDGAVFISAAGWDTEYGKTYPDREKPVEQRFAFVTEDMQKKHGITHKIVTYKEEDLAALLVETGFTDVQVTQSAFGNIKATARKP